ncbi:nitrogen assimilation regulatory protein NtrX [Novimethylophilus kurashikiensis]|uniref:Nitrogen assimilation regulatory protein NtrX n=1 Tax=Novimethylophilus kurashikiensis TaxID=1825523 RepID=A0A2R5F694_9PROT|nr:sigma-54 dependent transcriptional regulator [Novimethylophilus kurashikiensis]GBG13812.1 nitrogen assimilation regulatory protein NtrX [Novimethylophilus kurashikiensis]
MTARHILVVDDEIGIRELLRDILEDEGYHVHLAENAAEARHSRQQMRPDLVLLDIWMPDCDGVTLLKEWGNGGLLTMPVVMMSGHATIDTAVEATRIGAFDFLEKPIALQKLLKTVGAALRHGEQQPRQTLHLMSLGKSAPIVDLRQRLEQAARLNTPLLLVGPRGCGMELCAKSLHKDGTPWLVLDHFEKLVSAPLELLEQVQEGVLFIPEVAELNRLEQKGLLLLAQKTDRYDVRLVCATARALPQLVADGQFDDNLLQVIGSATVRVPALNEHKEDIPELAQTLVAHASETGTVPYRDFDTAALNALRNAPWPGGLAELEGAVKRLALTTLADTIGLGDVERLLQEYTGLEPESSAVAAPSAGLPISLDQPMREARDDFERLYFEHHIAKAGGNMSKVAEAVGLERTHLYRKLKQLGIQKAGN